MYSSMTNENGFGFSQPAFDPTELEFLSNGMKTEAEASNLMGCGTYCSSGSGCTSYVGSSPCSNSLASHSSNTLKHLLRRSISCHSLYKGASEDGAVRRVHSAGDLMENSMIIEGMIKVSRYSPEEKRERIERYRNKRNLRNFKKKIQYECRKILADRRRRSKGRFVRDEETSTIQDKTSYDNNLLNDQYTDCEEDGWINLLDYPFPSQN